MNAATLYVVIGFMFSMGFGPDKKGAGPTLSGFFWFWMFALGWPVVIGHVCRRAWDKETKP